MKCLTFVLGFDEPLISIFLFDGGFLIFTFYRALRLDF